MLKLRSVGQMAFGSSVCGWMPSLKTSRCFRRPEVPAVCRRARIGTGTVEAQRSLGIGQTKINAVGLDPNEIPSRSHCDGPCICVSISASSSGIHPLFYLRHWQQTPFTLTFQPSSRSIALSLTLFWNEFMQLWGKLGIEPAGQPQLLSKKDNSMN